MARPDPFAPASSPALNLAQLLPLLAQLSAARQPGAPAAAEPHSDSARLVREIVRASFADDPRGAALRDGWRQIAAGALVVLRAFAESADAPLEM